MSTIRFKVGPKKVGFQQQKVKYVARPKYGNKMGEKEILDNIEESYGGAKRGEVQMALDAVVRQFSKFMMEGHPIRLSWLGTFRVSFDSKSKDSPEGFSKKDIKNPRIIFTPDKELKKMLTHIDYEEYKED